jgi:hypothetical protein
VTLWGPQPLDGAMPRPGEAGFEVPLRAPALFQRAMIIVKRPEVQGTAPVPIIRLIFLMSPDAPEILCRFMVMMSNQWMQVLADDDAPKPKLLDTLLDPRDGNPIMIWQMPTSEPMPETMIQVENATGEEAKREPDEDAS